MNVVAVVVTYNKKDLLLQVIEALKQQSFPVGTILVIDNASTDGTSELLEYDKHICYRKLPLNTGGAGGFFEGMKFAYENIRPDFFWLMDDDCIPQPTALEKLIDTAKQYPEVPFFNSLVLWKDGSPCRMNIPLPAWEWTQNFTSESALTIPIQACSFVSCLVSKRAVELFGYPVAEFFIWYDDFEYTKRISAMGHGLFVPQSEVVHLTAENMAVEWQNIRDYNCWKYFYSIRNEVSWIFFGSKSIGSFLKACWRMIEIQKMMSRSPRKLRLKVFLSGLKGFFFNYRKHIKKPPELDQLIEFESFDVKTRKYDGEDWIALWGRPGIIHTHPPHPGIAPLALTLEIRKTGIFKSNLYLKDKKSKPVKFQVEVLEDSGRVVQKVDQILEPGGRGTLEFEIADGANGLRLSSYMAHTEDPCYHASAYWIDTRIEGRQ